MAEATVVPVPTKRLIIDLSPSEAETLKAIMQNQFYSGIEPQEVKIIREAIFNALQLAGVK